MTTRDIDIRHEAQARNYLAKKLNVAQWRTLYAVLQDGLAHGYTKTWRALWCWGLVEVDPEPIAVRFRLTTRGHWMISQCRLANRAVFDAIHAEAA